MTQESDCYAEGCDLSSPLISIGFEGHGIYGFSQILKCKQCGHVWIKRTDMNKRITWMHANDPMSSALQSLLGI